MPRAVAQLAYHFQVIVHPLVDAFRLVVLADGAEVGHVLGQVVFYLFDGAQGAFPGGDEDAGGVDGIAVVILDGVVVHRVYGQYLVHLVAPEHYAQHHVGAGQEDVHRVALHAEVSPVQFQFVAHVLHVVQVAQEGIAHQFLPPVYVDNVAGEVLRVAYAVEARHRRHHQHVAPPGQQFRRGGQAHLLNVLVDG